jgi:hypothetical protein
VDPVGIGRKEMKRNRTDFESAHENETLTLTQTLEGEKKLKEKIPDLKSNPERNPNPNG